MNSRMNLVGSLTGEQVGAVLLAATSAPSLYNSQPWRFRATTTAIELWADTTRAAPVCDPDRRELLMSCGAALMNLRLAIRLLGVHPAVSLLPDPGRPELLAVVRPQGRGVVTQIDRRLAGAMPRRHTNRRPFEPAPVPVTLLAALRQAAKVEQAWLVVPAAEQLPDRAGARGTGAPTPT